MSSPKKKKKGKKRGPQKLSLEEIEDSADKLQKKCVRLAEVLRKARCTMIYTGAGISTSASIPDYRGPNGVWTKAEKGVTNIESADPVHASPTYTHMALRELYKRGYIRHILSQNCDGFHLRSGIPQVSISEVHGNMHIEVCKKCQPLRQYVRNFDVTEKTRFRSHKTGRRCDKCNGELHDTIVHFGEVGSVLWPLNWKGTTDIVESGACDVILCLGTSLKILQKYKWLWSTHLHISMRPKVYIVNLQATPKDKTCALKINGRCDDVMQRLMEHLKIPVPSYCRSCDPVLNASRHRNSRNMERFSKLTECSCGEGSLPKRMHIAHHMDVASDASSSSSGSTVVRKKAPGWWGAGLKRTSQAQKRPKKPVGRPPKKRKVVKSSSVESVEDETESGLVTDISNPHTPATSMAVQELGPDELIVEDSLTEHVLATMHFVLDVVDSMQNIIERC